MKQRIFRVFMWILVIYSVAGLIFLLVRFVVQRDVTPLHLVFPLLLGSMAGIWLRNNRKSSSNQNGQDMLGSDQD